MPKTGLTPNELKEKAVNNAIDEIRKNGVERLKITDIAKKMNISHAALYKHFSNKEDLLDIISKNWLEIIDKKLYEISISSKKAEDRIIEFYCTLHLLKKEKVLSDPELYNAFANSSKKITPPIAEHLKNMSDYMSNIIQDGIKLKEFKIKDVALVVKILFEGTMSFHHPKLVLDNINQERIPLLLEVLNTLILGLKINSKV
ncbi:MAG: TetR/AcrR family transcriptional regulator [Candidatus Sericytochromatia bacterium]